MAGNLTVALPVNITNRIDASNLASEISISANLGGNFVPLPVSATVAGRTVAFNGLSVTTPASGGFSLRISNIRAAAYQLGGTSNALVAAQIIFSGTQLQLIQSTVTVGMTQPGLFATLYDQGVITCVGSPLPSDITLANLFSTHTFFASNRVTEGYATAFLPRGPGDDSGTRFLLQFSGFPAGARVFVPDFIAGSSAATPTAGGDLGVAQSGGVYVPGSSTLLLARIPDSDSTGAGGGRTVMLPAGSAVTLNSASEVPLANGSGYAVFEVLDANPSLRESAQIPVFIGMPGNAGPATAQETLSFAPLSTALTASVTAPIPRFVNVPVRGDCSLVGDCDAGYYPKLSVDANPVQFTAIAGGATNEPFGYVRVGNDGSGVMPWTAAVHYTNGSGWAFLSISSGVNNASIIVTASPKGLAAGTYKATLVVDAGSMAGSVSVPISLTVFPVPTPPGGTGSGSGSGTGSGSGSGTGTGTGGGTTPTPPTPPAPTVTVSRIVNAATYDPTPLVAGSLGTLMGANLAGKTVSVMFDDAKADLIYNSASQINLLVPASERGKNSASMVVTVDGVSSSPATVVLAPAWPAIFPHGVLNQDNSVNGPEAGAGSGSILQIYATGIPDGATVSVQIGDQKGLVPLYAGPAPTVPGVQQVNVAVPDGLTDTAASLVVCASAGSQQFCSAGYTLAVQ